MSDEEREETLGQLHIPAKLLEATSGGFRDRSKRRLSLPLSSLTIQSRKSSIASATSSGKQIVHVLRTVVVANVGGLSENTLLFAVDAFHAVVYRHLSYLYC